MKSELGGDAGGTTMGEEMFLMDVFDHCGPDKGSNLVEVGQ